MFGLNLDPSFVSLVQFGGGLLILLALALYLGRLAATTTKTLLEVRKASPVLLKIATEFAPDHETTLKDTTNRLEKQGQVSQEMNQKQQDSINRILAVLAHQEIVNNQVDATLAKLLAQLYTEQARLVAEGEKTAAIFLQTLINDLRRERDELHMKQPIGINVNLAGAGSSVGQVAAGSAIDQAQAGVDKAQAGIDKSQAGVDQTQAGINLAKKEGKA